MDHHKWKKEVFSHLKKEELIFTEKDRRETLHKIQDRKDKKKSALLNKSKRYSIPVLGSVTAVILTIFLLLPNLNFGNVNEAVQENLDEQQASQQDNSSFSVFLMGKDSADESNRRNSINMLLTYNTNENSMNVVSIPRDTYVDILNTQGEVIGRDKLIHASAYDGNSETAVVTLSNLLDIPIDYYAAIPEERIYKRLGIRKEDMKENRKLMSDMGGVLEEQLSASEIKMLLEESSVTNITSSSLKLMEDVNSESMEIIDMAKGAQEKLIEGIYYVEITSTFLEKTSQTLNKHLREK